MSADDDGVLELLGRALRAAEPVPDHVVTGARAASTWRTVDEELAELVFDSAVEASGVRSEQTARQLTFRGAGLEIEVMVVDDTVRRLVGQLVPPQATTVQLTGGDHVDEQRCDHLGRFTFEAIAPGPVRLSVLDAATSAVVSTQWILL